VSSSSSSAFPPALRKTIRFRILRTGIGGRIIELFLVVIATRFCAIIIIVNKEQTYPFL